MDPPWLDRMHPELAHRKQRLVLLSALCMIASVLVAAPSDAQQVKYMSDVVRVELAGHTRGPIHNVDVDVRVQTAPCRSSHDTCRATERKRGGFTWFIALAVELGDTHQPREVEYQLHGGLALGGIGNQNTWYGDWSGYYGPDNPVSGVLPGASQRDLDVAPGDWFRLRVWRVASRTCSTGEWGWYFSVTNTRTRVEVPIGTMCLAADTITGAYYFTEVIERDPCRTDLLWVRSKNFRYRDSRNKAVAPPRAIAQYSDETCTNSKLFVGHSRDKSNLSLRSVVDRRNLRVARDHDTGAVLWGEP